MSEVLQSIVCVTLDVHLFSGRRKVSLRDLVGIDSSALPPQDLVGLGHKKICDPQSIAPFTRLKREAIRLLLESGFRFLGGYGLPEDKLQEAKQELARIQQEFEQARTAFLSDYEQSIEDWVSRHPDWADIIRRAVPPVEKVAQRLSFGSRVFRVAPATIDDPEADDLMEGSYNAILREIATEAQTLWEKSLKGRSEVTQKALRPVRTMRDKLNGLAFIDARIAPVVDLIDQSLAACPKAGKFGDGALREITGLALLLSDTDRVVEHGEAALGISLGNVVASAFDSPEVDAEQADEAVETVEPAKLASLEPEEAEEAEEEQDEPVAVPERVASASGLFF